MNPSTALATVLVDELVRGGVREAVLCPGSRSAPLAYALQDAERQGRLRLHVRVDERSAGFLALGLAKLKPHPRAGGHHVRDGGGQPAPGRPGGEPRRGAPAGPQRRPAAGAARHRRQPDDGADRLLRSAVRWSHELAAPERRAGQNGSWRSVVARSCAAARGDLTGDAGPVHVNVPLREPLVPTPDTDGDPGWPDDLHGRPDGGPWVRVSPPAVGVGPGLDGTPRTLVVVGDLPRPGMAAEAVELARAAGWPVVAEPFGRYDRTAVLPQGPLLLGARDWLEAHLPERVLVVGRVTLARPVAAVLRHPDVRVDVVATTADWVDPSHVASRVLPWGSLAAGLPQVDGCGDQAWAAAWSEPGAGSPRPSPRSSARAGPRAWASPRRWRQRCLPGRRCSSAPPTRCATSTWPSARAASTPRPPWWRAGGWPAWTEPVDSDRDRPGRSGRADVRARG